MERDDLQGDGPGADVPRTNETIIRVSGPGAGPPPPAGDERARDEAAARTAPGAVRAEDTEPYIGLQYIARLFKIVSFLVIIALGLEILLGVASEGVHAILPLLAEIVQGGVLAAILWGAADVVLLLIDIGHDVRASRVLLGRMSARGEGQYGGRRDRER
jgi:hypothetical protein